MSVNIKRALHLALSAPPFVYFVRAMYESRFRRNAGYFRGVYPDFASATAAAPRNRPLGYDHVDGGKMYWDRPIFPEDYALMYWIKSTLRERFNVLDFGGHAGWMFDAFNNIIGFQHDITWTIFDVPAVAAYGEQQNSRRKPPIPVFISDLSAAPQNLDILIASGSLQYVDTDFTETLRALHLPQHLILNQLPLHESKEFVTLQNISTAFCPYWIRNRTRFFASLEGTGYELVDLWTNPGKDCRIPTYPEHTRPAYYGAYLRRRRTC